MSAENWVTTLLQAVRRIWKRSRAVKREIEALTAEVSQKADMEVTNVTKLIAVTKK